ncbi:MAG: hypothetical protein FWE11_05275 [Defluviitaleaceae bacterium]|nr:hypothetical protein [Defluviitaleaceae bacterium]
MEEFLLLIFLLLFIAFLQKGAEWILDKYGLDGHKKVVNIACIITSYIAVGRYAYVHVFEELMAFIGFII